MFFLLYAHKMKQKYYYVLAPNNSIHWNLYQYIQPKLKHDQ